MRQEGEAVTARRNRGGLHRQHVVAVRALYFGHGALHLAKMIPEPAQAHAPGGEGVHHVRILDGVIVHGHEHVGVVMNAVGRNADRQARANAFGEHPGVHGANPHRAHGVVHRAGADHHTFAHAQFVCHFRQDGAHGLAGFPDLGQHILRDPKVIEHFAPILLRRNVPVFGAGQHRAAGDVLSGQVEDDEILDQQDLRGFCEDFRLVFLDPEHLRRGPVRGEADLAGLL